MATENVARLEDLVKALQTEKDQAVAAFEKKFITSPSSFFFEKTSKFLSQLKSLEIFFDEKMQVRGTVCPNNSADHGEGDRAGPRGGAGCHHRQAQL